MLDGCSAGIAAKVTVGLDNAMAGDKDEDGVFCVGRPDGAAGLAVTDACGECLVRNRFAVGYFLQFTPHLLLEGRTFLLQRQVEMCALPGKIFCQLLYGVAKQVVGRLFLEGLRYSACTVQVCVGGLQFNPTDG